MVIIEKEKNFKYYYLQRFIRLDLINNITIKKLNDTYNGQILLLCKKYNIDKYFYYSNLIKERFEKFDEFKNKIKNKILKINYKKDIKNIKKNKIQGKLLYYMINNKKQNKYVNNLFLFDKFKNKKITHLLKWSIGLILGHTKYNYKKIIKKKHNKIKKKVLCKFCNAIIKNWQLHILYNCRNLILIYKQNQNQQFSKIINENNYKIKYKTFKKYQKKDGEIIPFYSYEEITKIAKLFINERIY